MPVQIQTKPRQEIIDIVDRQLIPVFSEYSPGSHQYLTYHKYEEKFKEQESKISDFMKTYFHLCKNFSNGVKTSEICGNPTSQIFSWMQQHI